MGMYPPNQNSGAEKLTEAHIDNFNNGKLRPPFKVRDYADINNDLGDSAIPNNFVTEPIWVRMGVDVHDDIRSHGCHYIKAENRDRCRQHDMWKPYEHMKDATANAFSKVLGYSKAHIDSMSFLHYCTHADTIVALDYEGSINHEDYFTEEEWAYTKSFQRLMLTEIFSSESRELMVARIMRKPYQYMLDKINALMLMGRTVYMIPQDENKNVKFMIYSGHDTQVDNLVVWLTGDIDSFENIPFASTVTFELKYSAKCLREVKGVDCFGVQVLFNGDPIKLKGCTGDGFSDTGCLWNEFTRFLQDNWYLGKHSDNLDLACRQSHHRDNDIDSWQSNDSLEEIFAYIEL